MKGELKAMSVSPGTETTAGQGQDDTRRFKEGDAKHFASVPPRAEEPGFPLRSRIQTWRYLYNIGIPK